ncbi:MAG: electron transfer flavoprotein subunit beta/FixA family protein [Gammaproteobacteria bacterium]|nr:electron transfer flavoprotein subunit beta/FixA family protein [Gammaproteobacteria bacterium]
MKILVGIKRVVDYNVRIRVKGDGSGIETDGVKMSINPFDEIALEEALRMKEAGKADEVIVFSGGDDSCQQQLRTGLAMGADRAVQINCDQPLQPLTGARAMLALAQREDAGLVILGKQAIDDDNNQVPQMLAALWGRPQATFVSSIDLQDGKARVVREVDAGLETIEVNLPAVVSVDLRLNEPRFVKLPDIMKAKRKPLEVVSLEDLGVSVENNLEVSNFTPPPARSKGILVEDTGQLVSELKNRGLV